MSLDGQRLAQPGHTLHSNGAGGSPNAGVFASITLTDELGSILFKLDKGETIGGPSGVLSGNEIYFLKAIAQITADNSIDVSSPVTTSLYFGMPLTAVPAPAAG